MAAFCCPRQGGVGCPALPFGFCPRLWDEAHVPGAEEDDAAIYAEALARRRHWPLWLPIVRPHEHAHQCRPGHHCKL